MDKLNTLLFQLKRFFKNIGQNIVFIPAVFGLGGVLLAALLYYLESLGISKFLIEKVPFLVVNNYDTASTLLSTFSAGVLSILVFSFSMVMLLLNQAGNNFSPRVLPGLISVKKHQYIIGLFLACILYCAVVLIGLQPTSNKYQLPGFSVLLGMLLTVVCLFAFIYFIDSISKSIQVQNILHKIFDQANGRMNKLIDNQKFGNVNFEPKHDWVTFPSKKTGYLQDINEEFLLKIAVKNNIQIEVKNLEGSFIMKDENILAFSNSLDEETVKDCEECLVINREGENVKDNYILGFKQITEIGLRAMSPGINDPATAITTIDYLTELFSTQMKIDEGRRFLNDENENLRVILPSINFAELLYQVMVEYRTYCKADLACMQKLVLMLKTLKHLPQTKEVHQKAIDKELELLKFDAEEAISNPRDLDVLRNLIS